MNNSSLISSKIKFLDKTATKSSAGFVMDVCTDYVTPTIIKISDEDAWRFYRANEWIFAVINRIVTDCSKIVPRVVPREEGKKATAAMQKRIDEVKAFVDDPNENKESFQDIREKFIRDMLVYGRGAIEKVLSKRSRRLVEIYALLTRYVKIKIDEHGNVPLKNAYKQQSPKNGSFVYFDRDELIFQTLMPTTESVYGLKPLDVLCNTVASDILRATYNSNFFLNGAEAGGILSLKDMSKIELKKFRQYWEGAHKGAKNAHKMVAVNVPIEYVRMAITNRDLEFSEYGRELRGKICAVYNMQPLILGIADEGNGKLNSQGQSQAYKDGALKPILSKESYVYTKEIVQEGFGYNDIKISFLDVDLADAVEQAKIDRSDSEAGIILINEIRARRGMIPVPWGDSPLVVLPGGGQVDPDTGRLISPSNQTGSGKPDQSKKMMDLVLSYIKKCKEEEQEVDEDIVAEVMKKFVK